MVGARTFSRVSVIAFFVCFAGCVPGRAGTLDDGSVTVPPDARIGRRDGSTDGRDGSTGPRDGSTAGDGSVPGDGSTARDGSTGFDASWLPDGATLPTERACDDGVDDDGDLLADCDDPDCIGARCDDMGSVCISFTCGGCVGAPSETNCGDGADEDCDGMTDCREPDCAGMVCGRGPVVCESGACPCPSGFSELECADSVDDDCDGLTDCADPDCEGRACAPGGMVCATGVCTCGTTLEFCNDRDEDCDGTVDDGCPSRLSLCCPSPAGSYGSVGSGTAFADPCPSGTVLMGVAGRASTRIDQLQPICAALVLEVDRTPGHLEHRYPVRRGSPMLGATHGGTGGTAFDDRCPGNDVVIGVQAHVVSDGLGNDTLTALSLQCGTVTVERLGLSWRVRITPTVTTPVRGGAGTPYASDCTNGAITRIAGRAASTVEVLSFTCQTLQLITI